MALHSAADSPDTVIDSERDWMIYRCSHGCYHVALDRVMVTLTEAEFHLLQDLMRRADRRFQRHGGTAAVRAH